MRKYLLTRKAPLHAITSFCEEKIDKYAIFSYFLKASRQVGASQFKYKKLYLDSNRLYKLIKGLDPENFNIKDDFDQTIFHLAAQYCKGEDFQILMEMKFLGEIDLDVPDSYGYTPIFYAAMANNVDGAEILVDNGCNINLVAGELNRSPLHVAAIFGAKDMVRFLLQRVGTGLGLHFSYTKQS